VSNYETVLVERHDAVAVVTLNRPDVLNTFNSALRRDLLRAVREVNDDPEIRVAVLTGAGRAFGGGADLSESAAQNDPFFRVEDQLNGEFKPVLMAIVEAPQPWISAVAGAAAGVSSSFAMACDLTVMADDAYLYQAFAGIGLIPDGGATWHLARSLGRKRAYEFIVSGEKSVPGSVFSSASVTGSCLATSCCRKRWRGRPSSLPGRRCRCGTPSRH
jgi:2-(1,2-epoxy-1,2-dihydrophenyl)acetyl-CoA isomerase